ncbi:hypothetical protein QPX35_01915 [Corynebacterium propinquum]|nr:hypothetical protein [Corynebacterium propinquum]MDK4257474.1 hypothetical protein [Corynebacterium propinquum]MDK4281666.1 hypothetical protein [Corynebacterium propinquum]MDK4297863.1 hypothetical protein [Corynebacterium propinquum]MDK4319845.1 hypothetical protein [Corynebacterium propinquum]
MSTPGAGTGSLIVGTTQPALWLEALDPGATESTIVTLWPSLANRKALAIPMAPAPITTMSFMVSAFPISLLLAQTVCLR